MTHDAIRLSFKIDAFEPSSIPMSRLAEYMADLATMLGEKGRVHFVSVDDGCLNLAHEVEYEAYPNVEARARAIDRNDAPADALKAFHAIDKRLKEDNTFASFTLPDGFRLEFAGSSAARPIVFDPVDQPGTIDGIVTGIGGKADDYEKIVPVYINTGGHVYTCHAARAIAKDLGGFLLGVPRRFFGQAQWQREGDATWTMKKFTIQGHGELDLRPLSEIVDELRAIPSNLLAIKDPWGVLMADRRDFGEPN